MNDFETVEKRCWYYIYLLTDKLANDKSSREIKLWFDDLTQSINELEGITRVKKDPQHRLASPSLRNVMMMLRRRFDELK